MSGFKAFLLRGNLIELAVAFIIGAAFTTVVGAFTSLVTALLAKAGGAPEVDQILVLGNIDLAPFINATISFVILAAIVYFAVVTPYQKAKAKFFPEPEPTEPAVPQDVLLLTEIRDALVKDR